MPTELRNFLALSYDELEELNLKAKEQRRNRVAPRQGSGGTAQVPDRRKADQGRDRALQRSRRPAAHARLRQEVPAQELGQPHLRRLLHPRLYRAARERSAPRHRLGRILLGARPTSSAPAKCWSSAKSSTRAARPTPPTFAACSRDYATISTRRRATRSTPPTKSRASSSRARCRASLSRNRQVRIRQHRRLLPLSARRSAAHLHRHHRRSAARHGLPEREGPSRSRALAV